MQTIKPTDPLTPWAATFCDERHSEPDGFGRTVAGDWPHAHLLIQPLEDAGVTQGKTAFLVRGARVRVIRGRKVKPGTEGVVKWIGESPAFRQSRYGPPQMETRIGLDVGAEKLVYLMAEYVVIVGEDVPFVRPAVKCPVCGEERPDYPSLNAHRAEAHPKPSGPTVTIKDGVAYTFGGKKYFADCPEHGTVLPKTVTWLARRKVNDFDNTGRDKWIDEERLYALPQCSVCGKDATVRGIAWTNLVARGGAATKCGAMCQGAHGEICDCICGGANHGLGSAAWRATFAPHFFDPETGS